MDINIVNPILDAMVVTLSTMAQIESHASKPIVKTTGEKAIGVVTGFMVIDGGGIKGSVALSFTFPVIQTLVKRMLRMDISSVDDVASDLAGELSNIVVGSAKSKLQDNGYDVNMSLPVVLSGNGHAIKHHVQAPVVLLPFKTECGEFVVEMCFEK